MEIALNNELAGLFAEQLLNYRLQMTVFRCNWEVGNTNKTNENRSVRTGQVELANRRLPLLTNPSEIAGNRLRKWNEPLKWHRELGTVSGKGNSSEEEAILPEIPT
ncbi:MAG: hypothetical protein WBV50_17065, partial [Candidatus Acidiferrum sp.]